MRKLLTLEGILFGVLYIFGGLFLLAGLAWHSPKGFEGLLLITLVLLAPIIGLTKIIFSIIGALKDEQISKLKKFLIVENIVLALTLLVFLIAYINSYLYYQNMEPGYQDLKEYGLNISLIIFMLLLFIGKLYLEFSVLISSAINSSSSEKNPTSSKNNDPWFWVIFSFLIVLCIYEIYYIFLSRVLLIIPAIFNIILIYYFFQKSPRSKIFNCLLFGSYFLIYAIFDGFTFGLWRSVILISIGTFAWFIVHSYINRNMSSDK